MKKLIILLIVIICFVKFSYSQWKQTTDLNGAIVNCISVNGTNIFAGTENSGVFFSNNNGNNWTAVNSGLPDKNIRSIVSNGTTVFVGTNSNGIYKTTDNGLNWIPLNSGLTNTNTIAINGSSIFAGSCNGGVVFSSDNGLSWTVKGLNTICISSMAINGNFVFTGTWEDCLFLSNDTGKSWTAVDGLSGITHSDITSIAANDKNIFAGSCTGVFKSSDNGLTWIEVNSGIVEWPYVTSLITFGTNIFAATNYGIYLSEDNGLSWIEVNEGLTNLNVKSLAVNDSLLFAGTNGGGIWKCSFSDLSDIKEINKINTYFNKNYSQDLIKNKQNINEFVNIYNIRGEMVIKEQLSNTKTKIDIKGLSKGVYILMLSDSENNEISKYMK